MIWIESPENSESEKIWFDESRKYRITWHCKFMGVTVLPKYVACFLDETGGRPCWDIVSKHRKLEPAQKACERHARKVKRLAKKLLKEKPPRKRRRLHVKRGVGFQKSK